MHEDSLAIRAMAFAEAKVIDDLDAHFKKADRIVAWFKDKPVPATTEDTMAKIADAVQPATGAGTSFVPMPIISDVVVNFTPGPSEGQLLGDPNARPAADPEPTQRKKRGPNKVKAKGKGGRPKKVRAEAADTPDTATVSEGEKDAPIIANGIGDHVEAPGEQSHDMAA